MNFFGLFGKQGGDRPRTRAFKAARPDRLIGRGAFSAFTTSPKGEVRRDLRGLIEHSRFAAQNSDLARSYEMMVRRHVVGPRGIQLQMGLRGVDGLPDRDRNNAIEAAWRRWGKRGACTLCGRLSWWQLEGVAAVTLAREGSIFLRIHRGRSRGPFGFQVQVVPIDYLDMAYSEVTRDRHIDCGIEYDRNGAVVAYYFLTVHPSETQSPLQRARVRVPAADVVHVIRHEEAAQNLGLPAARTTLRRFSMMDKYEEAALTAAHYGAAQMVFLTHEADATSIEAPPDDEIPIDEIEAGTIEDLPPGTRVENFSPNYPDAEMGPFMRHMATAGGAGLGVSYSGLTGDMTGSNFSSLRDGRGEERDNWRIFQRDLFEGMHDQVFAKWLPAALLSGAIDLPFSQVPADPARKWRPRGWPSVNPRDDARANRSDIELGLRAPSDIIAERGDDFEEVTAQIARDRGAWAEAGLSDLIPPDPAKEVAKND